MMKTPKIGQSCLRADVQRDAFEPNKSASPASENRPVATAM